jgi:hypothetical protein
MYKTVTPIRPKTDPKDVTLLGHQISLMGISSRHLRASCRRFSHNFQNLKLADIIFRITKTLKYRSSFLKLLTVSPHAGFQRLNHVGSYCATLPPIPIKSHPISDHPLLLNSLSLHRRDDMLKKWLPAATSSNTIFRTRDSSGTAATCRSAVPLLVRDVLRIQKNYKLHDWRRDCALFLNRTVSLKFG